MLPYLSKLPTQLRKWFRSGIFSVHELIKDWKEGTFSKKDGQEFDLNEAAKWAKARGNV